ncbi:hemerythrin domain-containing protein [Elizabethkingia meningoseptica]|uniref:hemerythrin domain-containing protein n=1 Tax=Elizabethkingia meningoseptica TaxID=238 RepID=UPI0023AF9099|nr:hemerythrin domain-containing protein [Elizabethkingia meningoseptica]MDE5466444.1 hemerythrin domain-containing protein [Elizabethkingia meningoseptica]MDE5474326.1 hemerythrin domain-containing protein [Elizabethkingia meningoseptica]MDE5477759.1 hemerythrin domain-containing protein [Elizabethkingia meningoseptica]MDE5483764.1 hemerythrin domain-containing protein [Elizabethkingia meningoseptica]MDE5501158.1 hemerythrin domain-containing protein [Elizabethkingia meningoseptica]
MKRNENIVLLSRDHHFGLLCSWKIRQGLKKEITAERIGKYIRYFWTSHLEEHFREEEEILFPHADDEFAERIRQEHQQIRSLTAAIEIAVDPELLLSFANALEQHIRFEERTWFPHLEELLDKQTMEEIGKALDVVHAAETDEYEDEFWV